MHTYLVRTTKTLSTTRKIRIIHEILTNEQIQSKKTKKRKTFETMKESAGGFSHKVVCVPRQLVGIAASRSRGFRYPVKDPVKDPATDTGFH